MCLKIYRLLTIFTLFYPSIFCKARAQYKLLEVPNLFVLLRDDLTLLDLKCTGKRKLFYAFHNGLCVMCLCFTAHSDTSLEEYINYLASSGNQTTISPGFSNHNQGTITSPHQSSQRGEIFSIKCIVTFITYNYTDSS